MAKICYAGINKTVSGTLLRMFICDLFAVSHRSPRTCAADSRCWLLTKFTARWIYLEFDWPTPGFAEQVLFILWLFPGTLELATLRYVAWQLMQHLKIDVRLCLIVGAGGVEEERICRVFARPHTVSSCAARINASALGGRNCQEFPFE